MTKLLAFGACVAMLALGPTLAHADINWLNSQRAWKAQDACAREAFKRFPDYTEESNAKRERARQLWQGGAGFHRSGHARSAAATLTAAVSKPFQAAAIMGSTMDAGNRLPPAAVFGPRLVCARAMGIFNRCRSFRALSLTVWDMGISFGGSPCSRTYAPTHAGRA